jgi:mannose-1-phosphate guanylyltransferase
MQAMILAAGLGTRLRPLTDERPKPAVPVGNRPLGRYALDGLAAAGVGRAVMNSHHLPEAIDRCLVSDAPEGMTLTRVHEPRLLGTGGGVKNGWRQLDPDEPLLVVNSDILFAPDLGELLDAHARSGATATMVLRADPDAARFGAVEIDADGWVRRLLGEPAGDPGPLRALMFTGVHVLAPRALDELPDEGCIIRESYRGWVARGAARAVVSDAPWRDLGTLEQYLAANVELARRAGGNLVHPEARVAESAHLDACVVGRGASVADGARLSRVVVWDGATARPGELADAVVTPRRMVPVALG